MRRLAAVWTVLTTLVLGCSSGTGASTSGAGGAAASGGPTGAGGGGPTGAGGRGGATGAGGGAMAMTCGAVSQPCCPSSSPCGSGLTCRDNGCQALPTDGTGNSCTVGSDCPTGHCERASASDGPGVCSRSCSPTGVCLPGWTCRAELGSLTDYTCQCLAQTETCNGLDDDCDGVVDDEPSTDQGCVKAKGLGYVCRNGACACATMCGGACTNLQSDANNCGACGKKCAIACAAGQCTTPVGVSVGTLFACAVLSNGAVACWGGALGTTDLFERWATPQTVEGLNDAVAISAGGGHVCALLANQTVACWGSNAAGQLGTTTASAAVPFPVAIPGLHDVTALASGGNYSCALLADTTAVCWGSDYYGQLGNGTTSLVPNPTPIPVPGLSGITAISASGSGHTCAVLSDGTVSCWGLNDFGEVGPGSTAEEVISPTPVPGVTGVVGIAAGWDHTCALLSNGTTTCWGQNANYELGTTLTGASTSTTPLATPGVSGAAAIASFGDFTCVLYPIGTVGCWGAHDQNELGGGNAPNTVSGLGGAATALATGLESSCVLLAGGENRLLGRQLGGRARERNDDHHAAPQRGDGDLGELSSATNYLDFRPLAEREVDEPRRFTFGFAFLFAFRAGGFRFRSAARCLCAKRTKSPAVTIPTSLSSFVTGRLPNRLVSISRAASAAVVLGSTVTTSFSMSTSTGMSPATSATDPLFGRP